MEPIQINEDLFLKIPAIEDAQAIFAVIDKNREPLKEFLDWVDYVVTYKDTEKSIEERIENFNTKKEIAFILYYQNKPIGSVSLNSLNLRDKKSEVGFWIDFEFGGKGFMTQAVRSIMIYGFEVLGLHRIEIRCREDNIKSVAIAKRLGFILEATLRDAKVINGEYKNSLIFGMLENEFKKSI